MRGILLTLITLKLLIGGHAIAQERQFRIAGNGGLVVLTNSQHAVNQSLDRLGFSGHLEAEYIFRKQIGIGIETGFASLKNDVNVAGLYFINEAILPILLKGKYYFIDSKVQPFGGLGLGVGMFFQNGYDLSNPNVQTNFLLKPEIGIRIHWFYSTLSYNYNGNYIVAYNPEPLDYNYFEMTVGINFFIKSKP